MIFIIPFSQPFLALCLRVSLRLCTNITSSKQFKEIDIDRDRRLSTVWTRLPRYFAREFRHENFHTVVDNNSTKLFQSTSILKGSCPTDTLMLNRNHLRAIALTIGNDIDSGEYYSLDQYCAACLVCHLYLNAERWWNVCWTVWSFSIW